MLDQLRGQSLIIAMQYIDRHWRFGLTAGLGPLASNGRRSAHDMLGGIDDVLMAAKVVAEHHPGGGRRRELLVELHKVFG